MAAFFWAWVRAVRMRTFLTYCCWARVEPPWTPPLPECPEIVHDGPERSLGVECPVQIEAGILDRHDRVAHERRDLAERHRDAVDAVRIVVSDEMAAVVQDLRARRRLAQLRHRQRLEGLRGVAGGDAEKSDHGNRDGRGEQSRHSAAMITSRTAFAPARRPDLSTGPGYADSRRHRARTSTYRIASSRYNRS